MAKRLFYSSDFKIYFFHLISCHSLVYTPLCGDSKLLIPWRCQSLTSLSFVIDHLSVRNALTFFIQQTNSCSYFNTQKYHLPKNAFFNILNSFSNFPGSGPRGISKLTHLYQTLFNYSLKYCGLWILHFHSPFSTRWASTSHLIFILKIPSVHSLLHPRAFILLFWNVL